jgi:hypothetical protein
VIWLLALLALAAATAIAWAALGRDDTRYDNAVHQAALIPRQRGNRPGLAHGGGAR